MKVSDVYGISQTGQPNTGTDLNPAVQSAGVAAGAQAAATGSKINYASLTLLLMFGILLGIKYGLEKRG